VLRFKYQVNEKSLLKMVERKSQVRDRPRSGWKGNIKMELSKESARVRSGLNWVRKLPNGVGMTFGLYKEHETAPTGLRS
jgi:3-deoxy-D-arabino-heptulosonate 7-phosphate (DAHP) synthase